MSVTLNVASEKYFGKIIQALGFTLWRYGSGILGNSVSPDPLATILGAGYFNPLGFMLMVGDLIFVRDNAGLEVILQVVSNTNLAASTSWPFPWDPTKQSPTGVVTVAPYTGSALAGALGGALMSGPEGVLYGISASVATATGTSEQVLGTYSLPANSLDKAGRRLRISAAFANAANANNKTAKLYFGSSVISTPTAATNGKHTWLDLYVNKTGANTQLVYGSGCVDTTPVTPYVNASSAETDTAAITIKATGTDGTSSAADITLIDFLVEYLN
jgi:hypothetical protein